MKDVKHCMDCAYYHCTICRIDSSFTLPEFCACNDYNPKQDGVPEEKQNG